MRIVHVQTCRYQLSLQVVEPGDTVVDATCGNGYDTLVLAQLVGASGVVHAFDVQPAAIASTQATFAHPAAMRGADSRGAAHYHCVSHEHICEHVEKGSASLVTFNLGYMPGADKAITTMADSTERAVLAALQVRHPCPRAHLHSICGDASAKQVLER